MSAEGLDRAQEAVEGALTGMQRFAADMKRRGIHVGIDGVCCTCDAPWPCPTSSGETVES